MFASLRERAGLEERERLAREMHDGIAQELVAVGSGSTRCDARRGPGVPAVQDLDALRAEVSRVLADLGCTSRTCASPCGPTPASAR